MQVRPQDMTGKSAGVILRRINPLARAAAESLHQEETEAWMRRLSLEHSPLHDTAPASTAAVMPLGRPGKQLPAATRRGVWRCLSDMLRRVEQRWWQEQEDAVTAQLLVVSAVDKVEATKRLGIELGSPEAAEVWGVLADLVSFAAMASPSWKPPAPPASSSKPPAPPPRL